MKTNVFAVASLLFMFLLTAFYSQLKSHFNRPEQYFEKIEKLEARVEEERLRHLLTSYQFQEFRQYVGTILPNAIKEKGSPEKSYPLRSLASVVQKPSNEAVVNLKSTEAFAQAAEAYRSDEFEKAAQIFEGIIRNQPYSPKMPEVMFLLVDSYYNLKRYDEALQVYDKMLDLYPELEVTGYAMLRVGKIYEYYKKLDQAVDLYKTVLKTFTNPDLNRLAHYSLRQAEL